LEQVERGGGVPPDPNMLQEMCMMEECNINVSKLVNDGNLLPGVMIKYLLEQEETGHENSPKVSKTSMKRILIGYATTECFKDDIYFDCKSWIHVKLFVSDNPAKESTTIKNKKSHKISAGVLSLLQICQSIPNTQIVD
jgi:hypothetical protein